MIRIRKFRELTTLTPSIQYKIPSSSFSGIDREAKESETCIRHYNAAGMVYVEETSILRSS